MERVVVEANSGDGVGHNGGAFLLADSTLRTNAGGGLKINSCDVPCDVRRTAIEDNESTGLVFFYYGGPARVEEVSIRRNGAGVTHHHASAGSRPQTTITDAEITDNDGWGVANNENTAVRVERSTIARNLGYGFVNDLQSAHATLVDCTIEDNTGRGILNGGQYSSLTLERSTVANNRDGGIISAGILSLTNSTISGNRAAAHGGAISVIDSISSFVFLRNVTITGNVADDDGDGLGDGGGIHFQKLGDTKVDLRSVLLAGNVDRGGEAPDCGGGEPTASGYNLIQDVTGCTVVGELGSNIVGQDPLLGPLKDNGGPTPTHALLSGSPAIDAGGACSDPDQRGVARPQGLACDIGALEFACGNGQITAGEQCDDGNTVIGDCCSPDCQLDVLGSSCTSDAEPCTLDACDGFGACTHVFPSEAGCHEAVSGGAYLAINDSSTDRADKVTWKWKGLAGLEDFGNPSASSSLTLCVADATGAVKLSATMPAGAVCSGKNCWRTTKSGYGYTDSELSPDGVRSAHFRASVAGSATIKIKGKGENLSLGELPFALPTTVRLLRSDAPVCWESRFAMTRPNEGGVFRATSE